MLKERLYNKIKDTLGDYLYGFDEKQMDVGFFSGKLSFTELILRPDTVNKKLEHKNFPF